MCGVPTSRSALSFEAPPPGLLARSHARTVNTLLIRSLYVLHWYRVAATSARLNSTRTAVLHPRSSRGNSRFSRDLNLDICVQSVVDKNQYIGARVCGGVGMLKTQRQFTAGGSFSCSARRGGTVGRGDRGGLGGSRGGSRTLAGRMLARPLASLSSDSSDLPLATEPSSAIGLSPSTADRKIFIHVGAAPRSRAFVTSSPVVRPTPNVVARGYNRGGSSVPERLVSSLPYLLPLFDSLRYGRFLMVQVGTR